MGPECERDGGEFWDLLAAVASGPRAQTQGVPVAAQLKSHPVELDLDCPPVAHGRRRRARQHRVDETRKLLARGHAARVSAPGRSCSQDRGRARIPVGVPHENRWRFPPPKRLHRRRLRVPMLGKCAEKCHRERCEHGVWSDWRPGGPAPPIIHPLPRSGCYRGVASARFVSDSWYAGDLGPSMASAELSRRFRKVVGYPTAVGDERSPAPRVPRGAARRR